MLYQLSYAGERDGLTGTEAAGWARTACLVGGQHLQATALGTSAFVLRAVAFSAPAHSGARRSSTCLSVTGRPETDGAAEPPARASSDCRARTCDAVVNSHLLYQLS